LAPCKFFDIDEEQKIESEGLEESEETENEEDKYEEDEELEPRDLIEIYVINRNHIREQSKSVIPVCGVLLTGTFGLLYFISSGNNNRIPISPNIVYLLVVAATVLVSSIMTSVISVQASSPTKKLPWTERLQLSYIVGIYNREYKWGFVSIILLALALGLFILIMLIFLKEYLANATLVENKALWTLYPKSIVITFR
jgi:hypothetical protein